MITKGGWWWDKVRRGVRTVYFVVALMASLAVMSLPVMVAISDVVVMCLLISSFTCFNCYSFREYLQRYGFKSSLTDIPLVSIIRSLIITYVYAMCDGPMLSHGPYLGTVTLCSLKSIIFLSIKACLFTVNFEDEDSTFLSKQRLHLKKSWGMPFLFLSSVVFALGHIVVAYRTSCRARRKLLFHGIYPEAVHSCKIAFSGYQKVPRSPTPSAGKTSRNYSEMRREAPGLSHYEGELPVILLADRDSLFITCHGLTIHYKLSMPGPSCRSLSSITFPNSPLISVPSKTQYHLYRSNSDEFLRNFSLYTPLLDGSPVSPLSEDVPMMRLDESGKDELRKLEPLTLEADLEANEQFGIVLVHGFGGGVFSWRNVMGTLAQQVGCVVAAFDRPGWGLTSRPCRKDWEENQLPNPYKINNQVDLLLSFCSSMGFSSVVLVGHDDGGLLALKAAHEIQSSANPKNIEIRGVVLLSVSFSRELVPAFPRILLCTSLGKKNLVRPLLRTEITQMVNRRAWFDPTKLTTEILNLYKAPLNVEGWEEALHEIGADDVIVPLKSVQSMASKLVNSRLVALTGCGHLPHEECPKALLAAISPFISKLFSKPEIQNH
ncbi:hydrolase acyltransferase (alpha beta hydrolase superfamily) [Olea europaea subsp. europaea]|uniref:Hydrolase acyltransferase (Alpha beta hydrolase superfamily) n=1 Tax=Olea europaea subsp. europaea TaxID=158383 RepID=A0A8S0UP85_OLEEU|nr:hydrolase acyltransferase (alpha beta hydrolase superfamily) [Olea europaea subsp. europaea]